MTDLFDTLKASMLARAIPKHDFAKDRTGDRHGKLTVIRRVMDEPGIVWLCRCDCGRFIEAASNRLIHKQSCGCLRSTAAKARWSKRHAG